MAGPGGVSCLWAEGGPPSPGSPRQPQAVDRGEKPLAVGGWEGAGSWGVLSHLCSGVHTPQGGLEVSVDVFKAKCVPLQILTCKERYWGESEPGGSRRDTQDGLFAVKRVALGSRPRSCTKLLSHCPSSPKPSSSGMQERGWGGGLG